MYGHLEIRSSEIAILALNLINCISDWWQDTRTSWYSKWINGYWASWNTPFLSSPVLEPTYCFRSYPGHRGCEEPLVGVHTNKPTANPALYKPSCWVDIAATLSDSSSLPDNGDETSCTFFPKGALTFPHQHQARDRLDHLHKSNAASARSIDPGHNLILEK